MADFRRAILLALPIALLLIGIAAWYFAGKAISPVRRLTQSAATITAEDLHRRLEVRDEPREFSRLIEVYNQMLDRLEGSFQQARRFSADAAHELNTPLMILQGHLDAQMQDAEPGSETQRQFVTVVEEVQRLQEIIRKLLLLSQADSGRLPIESVDLDMSALVEEIVEDTRLIAPELSVNGEVVAGIHIQGDPDLIRQCVFNLVSNAVKYNEREGFIKLALHRTEAGVSLDVTNSGAPIPADQEALLFDRFYRGDPSRNAKIEGRGLGLALSREFAKAHGGRLTLVENNADTITFRLELPHS